MRNQGPQKILMTADTLGGVWTYALELTKALQRYDISVHLATMGSKPCADQRKEAGKLANLCLYESDFALEWMQDPWESVAAAGEWLLQLEQSIQPDLIHLNNYVHGKLPWRTPVLMVGHSCVLSWWQAVKQEKAPASWNTYARLVKEGLQSADGVVAVSHSMMQALNEYYGPFASSFVIYNGREKNGFRAAAKEPFVFSMGRLWDEAKNMQALQSAAAHLSWPVWVAGEDDHKLQKEEHVLQLLGKLNMTAVAEYLSRASIFVMPAFYEPFGLSALEAAFSGCALVLGDIPSLREVWGGAALFADPRDPQALQWQMERLIQQPHVREEMAAKAMRRAKRYSLQAMAQKYMEVYQQLLPVSQAQFP